MEDSRWAKRAWDDPLAQSRYAPVPGSLEDAKTTAALDAVRTPTDELRLSRVSDPRPARDLGLFYTGQRRALSVTDVVQAVRRPLQSNDFSGQPGGFIGSLRNVLTPFG